MKVTSLTIGIARTDAMSTKELRALKERCRDWYAEHLSPFDKTSRMFANDVFRVIAAELERREFKLYLGRCRFARGDGWGNDHVRRLVEMLAADEFFCPGSWSSFQAWLRLQHGRSGDAGRVDALMRRAAAKRLWVHYRAARAKRRRKG